MSAPSDDLFALVLAAGGSRRLGTPKQLLTIDGESLFRRAVRCATATCGERTIAVLGCEWQRVLRSAAGSIGFFAINEEWRSGLASSIRLGVRAVPEGCPAVLVLLADQPLVDEQDLARLVAAWRGAPQHMAASRYDDALGVPAIFPRSYFPGLLDLAGDRGARSLLQRHRNELTIIDCAHAALDIDTPEDAAAVGARPSAED